MKTTAKHFIDLNDIGTTILKKILCDAHRMKKMKTSPDQIFNGLSLAMIFDKPSTRTRVSFEVGFKQLGGHTIVMNKNDIQMGHSETIYDTVNVLSRMVDAIMVRISNHHDVLEMAKHANIPIINALTDESHPCQIMADLMTIEEKKGMIEGLNIIWLGDYNNVAKTLAQAASLFAFNFILSIPKELTPEQLPLNTQIIHNPQKAIKNADVVITDTWTSMGQEGKDERIFIPYQVNQELMKLAKPDAIFMHCLPAHRGHEVTNDVIDGRQSVVFDEAENRLHVQKAIMAWCLEDNTVCLSN